jgi:hypothetical protein
LFEFTARRPFCREIRDGEAEPEQFAPSVANVLEAVTCAACATRFLVVSDQEFENRRALGEARQELARREDPLPAAPPATVH